MLPFDYQLAVIEVEAERQDNPPRMTRMRYRIEIATDEPQRRVELLHRNIRQFGTITNTLAAAVQLTGEVIPRRPTPGADHPPADGNGAGITRTDGSVRTDPQG